MCAKDMGKASKWIRNLLMGKREEKNKKETTSFSAESLAILAATDPKEKRRWSFGRSSNADISSNKSSRSFESIVTIQPQTKVIAEFESKQNHATGKPVAGHKTMKTILQAKPAAIATGPLENAAATKIQAIFRSYLVQLP